MRQRIYTGSDEMTLRIVVSTTDEQMIRLLVIDSEQENTVLTDRLARINGTFTFFIGLPLCRENVDIILLNAADNSDCSFTYHGVQKLPLEKRLDVIDLNKNNLRSFIIFIQNFCYNASILRTNDPKNEKDLWRSGDWRYFIKYLPVIRDYETGIELSTPARISVDNGLIEVSQKYFIGYTVPVRLCCLLHEFSHPFLNLDCDDESEADLNGLLIYLGLGFPRYEAAEGWCRIFDNSQTDENMDRIAIIKKFIEDFDNNKIVIQ